MITTELQKAIYEYREKDIYNRYPNYIFMDSKTYSEFKSEIEPLLTSDKSLKECKSLFCGIQIIEDNCIQGFQLWSRP